MGYSRRILYYDVLQNEVTVANNFPNWKLIFYWSQNIG